MEFFLTHNPYTIETFFTIGDVKCNDPWFTTLIAQNGISSRLQMWITRFFEGLHEAYPSKEKFYLTYKGTSTDCQDIVEEAKNAQARLGVEFIVKVLPCGDPENKFQLLQELHKKAISGPFEGFKALQLNDDFQKISDRKLAVSVMAPMKNGKSTLLNAILGEDLLPHATQRCTAKISFIEHDPKAQGFEAKKMDTDKKITDYIPCTNAVLKEWNEEESTRHVFIRGNLPGLHISDYRLQFVDTPGPDSATHPEDKTTVERFLNDNTLPMVCYIIDRVNDSEKGYLDRLKKHMSKYGKQSEDRFIFVISRMDQVAIDKGCTFDNNPIKTKVEEIRKDLQKLGINNPRIFPVSPLIALKVRDYKRMTDEEDQYDARDDFKKFRKAMKRINASLMDYMSISPSIKNMLDTELHDLWIKFDNHEVEKEEQQLRLVELLSGIPALEAAIEEYLLKYSVPARIYDAASVFDAGIKQANAEGELLKDISSKKTSLAEIAANIQKLRDFLTKGKGAQEMKKQMFPEKWVESPTLKKELSTEERDFDIRIREEISDWVAASLDAKGTISPEESTNFIKGFIGFMSRLQSEMLGVYANEVEDDAKRQFDALKNAYDEKIKDIMGQMPPALRDFMQRFDFVLRGTSQITLKTDQMIQSTTEEYIEKEQREITLKRDGFWRAFWAVLPWTDLIVEVDVTKTRVINRVDFKVLKTRLKKEASLILQEGLDNAEKMAERHYTKLRSTMLEEFKKVEQKLSDFNTDLQKKLSSQQAETKKLEEYAQILDWVKNFQEELKHVLDLEVQK